MIHVLEGGTDAAMMILFDPEALPDDYDERVREDAMEVIERAAGEGRLLRLEPGGDGGYSIGLCIGEGPPGDAPGPGRRVAEADRLRVVGGRLFFAGVEYGFRGDDAFLAKRPHMGESAEVSPGEYRVLVYEADYPEGFFEDRLRERASPVGMRLDSAMTRFLLPLGSLGAISGLVGLVALGWREWRITALPVSLAMILPAALVSLTRAYREAREARREVAREFPDYWAVLEPVGSS